MNDVNKFQVLDNLIAFPHADDDVKEDIGFQIGELWKNRYGAVGMLQQIRSELQNPQGVHGGGAFQVLRFFAHVDIFHDGAASHLLQVISVGRSMRGAEEEFGGWFELEEDGNAVKEGDEEKWNEITHVMETRHTMAGTLYFDLVEEDGSAGRLRTTKIGQHSVVM